MSTTIEKHKKNWWADGDTPVHSDSLVAYAVDAHSTFLTMCRHFLMARTYIYIAAWGMTPLMELVRGTDQRAGPDGSPQQEALLVELREEALQEPEIDFWCTHALTVQAVLGYMVSKGVAASTDVEGAEDYKPIYVHAKVTIVDDVWSTLGSANLNNRGMRDDTELNVATLDGELARGLRMVLWAEHLELIGEGSMLTVARHLGHLQQRRSVDERAAEMLQSLQEKLGDPLVGLQLMIERAQDNLRRFHARQPLVGHLLPYVTGKEAKQQGWRFHEEHGWVEAS